MYDIPMCGIAGKVYLNKGEVKVSDLKKMGEAIAYRGPDDEGFFISPDRKLGFVNRRLAIIDLSSLGHQPMRFKGRYWITYNGEVYNFQEEKAKLEKAGYRFTSKSDTEVILALYDKYGKKCLNYLRGMFAFAIYDEKEKTLFLARDRVGKKPLKYFLNSEVFIFASELKAILTQKEVSVTPDFVAIHNYLTYGYTHSPRTGFNEIKKLPPAHYMWLDLKTGKSLVERYWRLDFSEKLELSEEEWGRRIRDELKEATRLRMISDVPVGAFLSGGVDSSGVVAMMAGLSASPVKTFSIGFAEKKYSELKFAKKIARLYGTDHEELVVAPEAIEILPDLVYQYEEPYADASALITYLVSKLARRRVTVILNGDGGDENFAGYLKNIKIKRDAVIDEYKWLLRLMKVPAKLFRRAGRFLNKMETGIAERYVTYNCYFLNEDKEGLYTPFFVEQTKLSNSYELTTKKFWEAKAPDVRDSALYSDIETYLPEDLLTKVDIASMMVSLEGRSPFLDHKMLELTAKIPYELKVRGKNNTNYILKKALEPLVPKGNLYRPKMGFSVPLDKWFTGKLNSYAGSKLLRKNSRVRRLFKPDVIENMLAKHSQKNDFGPKLWNLLTLELWFEKYGF